MNTNVLEHFKAKDPIMYEYLKLRDIKMYEPASNENYFYRLCRSIAYQQLSGKAAASIFNRLLTDIGKDTFTEQDLLKYSPDKLRTFGFSNSKCQYMLNIANASMEGTVDFANIHNYEDEQIIEQLVKIKGVGRWTAEMFLLGTICREDIFSMGDLGLKKGILKMYNKKSITPKQIETLTKKWKPYRSYASLALWDCLDN